MKEDLMSVLHQVRDAVIEVRKHAFEHIERRELAAHEFTALLPLRSARGLGPDPARTVRDALTAFADSTPSPFDGVPGLHSARFVLLDSLEPSPPREGAVLGPVYGPLVFAFVCDGNVLDVLEELLQSANPLRDRILAQCEGYPDATDPQKRVAYLRAHRIRSSYLVRDTQQRDLDAPHLHASAREIQRALDVRREFMRFMVANQGLSAEAQQQAFRALLRSPGDPAQPLERRPIVGYPFALSAFERPIEHEGLWVRRTAEIARARARRDARQRTREGKRPAGLRGVHAKHHGLLRAQFTVRADLPARLRHGVFVPGRQYDAWVRPSNSAVPPMSDLKPDARGLSIKLLDVGARGAPVRQPWIPDGIGAEGQITQDFTFVSHPTFFVKDARDYAILRSLIDARPDGRGDICGLAASAAVFALRRPREVGIFARTLLRLCRHPLTPEFHSLLPSLLGPNLAAKFSLRPTEATRRILGGDAPTQILRDLFEAPSDHLRVALQRSLNLLQGTALEFEFAAHIAGEQPLPVEDPRVDWDAHGAERIVMATLTITAQDATSHDRMQMAEDIVFTPWHALAAHRPLGSLNRSRLPTYLASAEERSRANANAAVGGNAGADRGGWQPANAAE